jgi:starvation-inducible outer membrane lipoprotein
MRMTTPLLWVTVLLGLSGCASLPTGVERPVSSHTDRAGEPSRLAGYAAPYLRKHPSISSSATTP